MARTTEADVARENRMGTAPHEGWRSECSEEKPTPLQQADEEREVNNVQHVAPGLSPRPRRSRWGAEGGYSQLHLHVRSEASRNNKPPKASRICLRASRSQAQCARSATIWACGCTRNPYFVILWASLLFDTRF